MACENENQRSTLTLRDVALAALLLDASGGPNPVSWQDVIAKANALAAEQTNVNPPLTPPETATSQPGSLNSRRGTATERQEGLST